MKRILLALCLTYIACYACAQQVDTTRGNTGISSAPMSTTVGHVDTLSTRDIARNYNIEVSLIDDTAKIASYIEALRLDFAEAELQCQRIGDNVERTIQAIEQSYTLRDSTVWIDSSVVIVDYIPHYRQRLLDLQTAAHHAEVRYAALEKQRIEEARRIAEERARLEEERLQQQRNAIADTVKQAIDAHHRTITSSCEGVKGDSKARVKELKSIYYAYLTIYNRFNLTAPVDNNQLRALHALNDFQQHLLDSVLGPNSYQVQAENFRNTYKARCGKTYSDAFKSYNKLFKQISIPISFNNMNEYWAYIQQYRDIRQLQEMYVQSVMLREQIATTRTNITTLYSKKYKNISSAYTYMEETVDMTPAFTTIEGGNSFLNHLAEFQQVQQRYIDNFQRLETIQHRGDTLAKSCSKKNNDVAISYRILYANTNFVPTFKTLEGAAIYEKQLDDFEAVQQLYLTASQLRESITQSDDAILSAKGIDRDLTKGYKSIKGQINFTPTFGSTTDGNLFLDMLRSFMQCQETVASAINNQRAIEANNERIKSTAKSHSNLLKAYQRLIKTYQYQGTIIVDSDLYGYIAQQQKALAAQKRILDAIASGESNSLNSLLRKVNDPEKIKLILNVE